MSEAKDELQSTEMLSSRCWSEHCRLMRGAVNIHKYKPAFTLAEVLITLGIIGVVAAMTLPALTAQYQRYVIKKQFLKAYSNFQNALNLTIANNGTEYECYNLGYYGYNYSECQPFWDDFKKNLKVINTCNYLQNCKVKYKTPQEVVSEGGVNNNNTCTFLTSSTNTVYTLSDGSYFIQTNSGHNTLYFTLDVNGEKGPNKWGYDVFYLMLQRDTLTSGIKFYDSICALKEKGGYFASELLKQNKL